MYYNLFPNLNISEVPAERMAQATENATNMDVEITWAAPVLTVSVTMPHGSRQLKLQKDTDVEYNTISGKKLLVCKSQYKTEFKPMAGYSYKLLK